ncbi:MAG: hypothetical protein ACTS9Y_00450 [Methylophilus sp.]|uniref:hypothetical protein n=1 Tax=Methylophilus sp. TaxID=29541 RepID=UPI003FA0C554
MPSLDTLKAGFKPARIPVTNELSPNVTLSFTGYHLSYNAYSANYGCATTALVLNGHIFLVLNGDHSLALKDTCDANGLQGGLDYFLANIDEANRLGEHLEIAGVIQDVWGLKKYALEYIGQSNMDRFAEAVKVQSNKIPPTPSAED